MNTRADNKHALRDTAEPKGIDFANILDSLAHLTDDAWRLGLTTYRDQGRGYLAGEATIYAGQLYVANQDTAGPFVAAHWSPLSPATQAASAAFDEWDNATTYAEEDVVLLDQRIWQSLQNGNTGNVPTSTPAYWVEISPAPAGVSLVAERTFYPAGSLVIMEGALHHVTVATLTGAAPLPRKFFGWSPVSTAQHSPTRKVINPTYTAQPDDYALICNPTDDGGSTTGLTLTIDADTGPPRHLKLVAGANVTSTNKVVIAVRQPDTSVLPVGDELTQAGQLLFITVFVNGDSTIEVHANRT